MGTDDATENCPWCHADPSSFRHHDEKVGCSECGATIPVEAGWYQNGARLEHGIYVQEESVVESDADREVGSNSNGGSSDSGGDGASSVFEF